MRTKDTFNLDQDKLKLSHLPRFNSVKLIIPNEFVDFGAGTIDLDKIGHWLYEGTKYENDIVVEYETKQKVKFKTERSCVDCLIYLRKFCCMLLFILVM